MEDELKMVYKREKMGDGEKETEMETRYLSVLSVLSIMTTLSLTRPSGTRWSKQCNHGVSIHQH